MKATDTTIPIVGIDKKIPFKEKLLFSLTPGLGTFYLAMISTWLLFYYTDILKINDAFVGVMFVVVRVADAIITPIFGVYLDRQNTRWGKYKPWMLIIWAGMAVGGFLTFCPVNFGQLGNTIYATVTYIIYSIFISMNQAPTMGMTASMTKRQDDRMTISTQNFIWTVVFTLLVSAASLPLINLLGNGNQGDGFRNFMLIFMIIGIFLILVIVKVIKERFVFSSNENQKLNVKAIWDSLIKNKYAMIAVLINFSINIFNGVRSAIGIYYYKYFFNDTNMMVIVGTLSLVPMLIGVFFSSVITKKIGVKNNILLMVIITIVSSVAMFFIPATASGKITFYALYVLGGLFMGFAMPAQLTMIPLAIDYGEWKNKTSSGGFFGAINGFTQTLATAISGGLIAAILVIVNYVPNVTQSTNSLIGIKFMMSVLPAIVISIGLVIFGWDMTDKKHQEIIEELNKNRKSESKDAQEIKNRIIS